VLRCLLTAEGRKIIFSSGLDAVAGKKRKKTRQESINIYIPLLENFHVITYFTQIAPGTRSFL
jgi:hypothetical protein